MADPLDQVLRLVSEGRLSAEEAAPILDALEAQRAAPEAAGAASRATETGARFARIEVLELGRKAVDLRIPLSLGRMAIASIPGLSGTYATQLKEAIARGVPGPILDIADEDGGGVRIVLE
jgi:hypothetical protein